MEIKNRNVYWAKFKYYVVRIIDGEPFVLIGSNDLGAAAKAAEGVDGFVYVNKEVDG